MFAEIDATVIEPLGRRGEPLAGGRVSRIESEVLRTFMQRLNKVDEVVPAAVAAQLGALLGADKLPKADVLVALFAEETGDRRA